MRATREEHSSRVLIFAHRERKPEKTGTVSTYLYIFDTDEGIEQKVNCELQRAQGTRRTAPLPIKAE